MSKHGYYYTHEEISKIKEMYQDGASNKEIADAMGRSEKAICSAIKKRGFSGRPLAYGEYKFGKSLSLKMGLTLLSEYLEGLASGMNRYRLPAGAHDYLRAIPAWSAFIQGQVAHLQETQTHD